MAGGPCVPGQVCVVGPGPWCVGGGSCVAGGPWVTGQIRGVWQYPWCVVGQVNVSLVGHVWLVSPVCLTTSVWGGPGQ